jgi:hypothetical protein
MANINMEVVSTPPSYVMGERRQKPHAHACHASPHLARAVRGRVKGARHLHVWSGFLSQCLFLVTWALSLQDMET